MIICSACKCSFTPEKLTQITEAHLDEQTTIDYNDPDAPSTWYRIDIDSYWEAECPRCLHSVCLRYDKEYIESDDYVIVVKPLQRRTVTDYLQQCSLTIS